MQRIWKKFVRPSTYANNNWRRPEQAANCVCQFEKDNLRCSGNRKPRFFAGTASPTFYSTSKCTSDLFRPTKMRDGVLKSGMITGVVLHSFQTDLGLIPMLKYLFLSVLTIVFASHGYSAEGQSTKHRFISADSSKKRIAIIDENGKTEWEMKIGPLHDLHLLDNGNILLQTSWTHVAEVEQATGKVIWEYDASKQNGNAGKKLEVHAFQRLANGNTMIVESGTSRILELDSHGKIVHEVALKVSQSHPHRDTRLVRKLESGNYLVCHEGDGIVREYSPQGATVWEFAVPLFDRSPAPGHGIEGFGNQCFSALRLASGNTLISTGNGHRVIEVTRAKEIVWQLTSDDLPGIELAWITTIQQLPSGNIVIGNCHAGEKNPQIIEVNRQKKIVWQFHDFERFGNSLTNTQILTTDGSKIVAKLGQDR